MNRLAGQAVRALGEVLFQLGRIGLLLFMLVLLGFGLLGFRLSQGPIEIPHFASRLATDASGGGISVQIKQAELAWAGYHEGGGAPLYVRLGDISVRNAAGLELASIPSARLVAFPSVLFRRPAPIWVNAEDARFNGSIVPVSLAAEFEIGARYRITHADMAVTLGPGRLGTGVNSVPITGGSFGLQVSAAKILLSGGMMHLAPHGASAPLIGFSGSAAFARQWQGSLTVTADRVAAPDLATYWPPLVLKATRHWVVKNITAGTALNASFTFGLTAPGNLSDLTLASATGDFTGQNLTLSWIAGVRPITALNGRFTVQNIDQALVTASSARLGGLALSHGQLIITGMNHKDQTGQLSLMAAGGIADAMAIISPPPLELLRQAPPQLVKATGSVSGSITATLPFKANLSLNQVTLDVDVQLRDAAIPGILAGLDVTRGTGQVNVTTKTLGINVAAQLAGEPAKLNLAASLEGVEAGKFTLAGLAGPELFHHFGLDAATALTNPVAGIAPFTLTVAGTFAGLQNATLAADLKPLNLSAPGFGWAKPAGMPGTFNLGATLKNDNFVRLDRISASATGLDLQGQAEGRRMQLSTAEIGDTHAAGSIIAPDPTDPNWSITLSGPSLDLRANTESPAKTAQTPAPSNTPPTGPLWRMQLTFNQLRLAASPAPELQNFAFSGSGRGGTVLQAKASAEGIILGITAVTPLRRELKFQAADAGLLLRQLNAYDGLQGGGLSLDAQFGGAEPTQGTVKLQKFRLANPAPLFKILQSMTIYGVPEAASGPGLVFDRAILPFTADRGTLSLADARAFSASLGFTASGTIGLRNGDTNLDATIVPLYAFNSALGNIPLLGKIFSAEKGGGLFAARAKITGPLSDPKVSINPLSALTPGVFRGLFGLGGNAESK